MYQRWTPRGRSSTSPVELLVLPKRCRGTVLKLAHDIVPLAGHLRKEITDRRLLRQFFWPTLFLKGRGRVLSGVPDMPEIGTEEDQMCPISAVTNNNRTVYTSCDGYSWTVAEKSIG